MFYLFFQYQPTIGPIKFTSRKIDSYYSKIETVWLFPWVVEVESNTFSHVSAMYSK